MLPREGKSAMICFGQTANTSADQPEEGGGIFGVIEEVGEVENQERKIIDGVNARIHTPQKPFVAVKDPLAD